MESMLLRAQKSKSIARVKARCTCNIAHSVMGFGTTLLALMTSNVQYSILMAVNTRQHNIHNDVSQLIRALWDIGTPRSEDSETLLHEGKCAEKILSRRVNAVTTGIRVIP